MTLKDEILALPAAIRDTQDAQVIADALSVGRTRLEATEIGNGSILETIGLAAGNALLDVINTAPDFRYVRPLLEQGRLRVDSVLVRATLDSLVPAVLTLAQADALKALAAVPDPVDEYSVRVLSWSDDGAWLMGETT